MDKKSQLFWSIWNIVEAIILLTSGILCIVFREDGELAKFIAYIVGAFVILDGSLRAILYFTGIREETTSGLLVGGFEITGGIVIMLQYQNFITIIVEFLYVLLLVMGGLILGFSILAIVKKKSTLTMPILQIVFGSIIFAIGLAVCILFNSHGDDSNKIVMIIVGSILILVGGAQLVITIIQTVKALKKQNTVAPVDEPAKPEYGKAKEAEVYTPKPELTEAIEVKEK